MNNNSNNNDDFFSMFNTEPNKENIKDEPKEESTIQNNNENLTKTDNSENISQVYVVNNNETVNNQSSSVKQAEIVENNKPLDNKEEKYQKDVDINKVLFGNGSEDVLLLSSYIGPNYEKIRSGGFNIWAAIFGNFYFFYHKMYLIAFIIGIINCLLNIFFPTFINNFIFQLIAFVLYGIFTNSIYMMYAKSRIKKIKQKHGEMSRENLASLCAKEGESGIGSLIIGVLIMTIISISIYVIFAFFGYPIKTGVESVDNIFNNISSLTNKDEISEDNNVKENESNTKAETFDIGGDSTEYEQVLNVPDIWDNINISFSTDTSIAINYPLTFPSNFERVSGSPYLYDYVDFNDTPNDFCRLLFVEITSPSSFENLRNTIDEYVLSNNDYSSYTASNINDDVNTGFIALYTYDDKKYTSIFANISSRRYLYEIISSGNYDNNLCVQYANSTLNNS